MTTTGEIDPQVDQLRLHLIEKGHFLIGLCDCERLGDPKFPAALAAAYARTGMRALLIDLRASAQASDVGEWTLDNTFDEAALSDPLVVLKAAAGATGLYGDPVALRSALMAVRRSFAVVVCATDPVLRQDGERAHAAALTACDTVVVRAISNLDRSDRIALAIDTLVAVGAKPLGCILETSEGPFEAPSPKAIFASLRARLRRNPQPEAV
jgi:hypothetical protein